MGDKKLYFKLSGIIEPDYIIVLLGDLEEMIKNDLDNYNANDDDLPNYTVEPIYLTQEEFNALPEFNG